MSQTVNKEEGCRPVVFYEEVIESSESKCLKLTPKTIKPQIFQFSKVLCIFSQSFDKLHGLEMLKYSKSLSFSMQFLYSFQKISF